MTSGEKIRLYNTLSQQLLVCIHTIVSSLYNYEITCSYIITHNIENPNLS